ncbi:MAG: hypothetical protein JXB47_15730 [Anaerolineae bacterium]|nr:hypothetical protein [Anaerolineae bacterium]
MDFVIDTPLMFLGQAMRTVNRDQTASKVRRAVLRLWIDQPAVAFRDAAMLRKMDAVVYEAIQLMIRRRWQQIRRLRIAAGKVTLSRGVPTLEGERWVTMAMARILPLLIEYESHIEREEAVL